MKKYNVTTTRTDEYEIEIDETIWSEEYLNRWKQYYNDSVYDLNDLVEYLSFLLINYGCEDFIEGFGYLYAEDSKGKQISQFRINEEHNLIKVSNFTDGIKVKIISMEEDYNYDIEELY